MAVFILFLYYIVSCTYAIYIIDINVQPENQTGRISPRVDSLISRKLNSSKMHRFQSSRLTYRKHAIAKISSLILSFVLTRSHSFISSLVSFNGRSCANVACNLSVGVSLMPAPFSLLFSFLFFFFF